MIDPLVGGAIISGGANLLGSLLGKSSADSSAEKALQATRETNQTNIQLQREANSFNQQMWLENNEYNSLDSQKQRALAAGFNPNILTGSNSVSSSPVQQSGIPNQESGAAALSALGSQQLQAYMQLAQTGSFIADAKLKSAQEKDTLAGAQNKEADTETKNIDNLIKRAQKDALIELPFVSIDLQKSEISKNEQSVKNLVVEANKMNKEIESLNETIKQVQSQTQLLNTEDRIKRIEEVWKSKEFEAQINLLHSQAASNYAGAALSYEQVRDLVITRSARCLNLTSTAMAAQADAALKNSENRNVRIMYDGIQISNDAASFALDMYRKYGDTDKVVGYGTDLLKGIGSVLLMFGAAKGAGLKTGEKPNLQIPKI